MRLNEIIRSTLANKVVAEGYFDREEHPDAPSRAESKWEAYVQARLPIVEKSIVDDFRTFEKTDTFKYCMEKFAWFPSDPETIMHDYPGLVDAGLKKYVDATNYSEQFNGLIKKIKTILQRQDNRTSIGLNSTIIDNRILEDDDDIWSLFIFKNADIMNKINKIFEYTEQFGLYGDNYDNQCSEQDAKQFVTYQLQAIRLFSHMLDNKEYQSFYDFMDGEEGIKEIFRCIQDDEEYSDYLDSMRGDI